MYYGSTHMVDSSDGSFHCVFADALITDVLFDERPDGLKGQPYQELLQDAHDAVLLQEPFKASLEVFVSKLILKLRYLENRPAQRIA